MLKPPDQEDTDVRIPHTAASTMSSYIEKSSHIHKWEMRYLAIGMGRRPDLARLAASETYNTGLYAQFEGREKQDSGRRVDEIIERALDTMRIHEKADYGTAFHQHTEPGAPRPVDEEMERDVLSFEETLRRECIIIEQTEQFTVNDALRSAGTFDHLIRILGHPALDGLVIADKKTGSVKPHEWAVQLATYAHGLPYDREADRRYPWPGLINTEWALVLHTSALTGKTVPIPVDLTWGWVAAQHAAAVREFHSAKVKGKYVPPTFEQRLAACASRDDCRVLWRSTDDVAERAMITERVSEL